MDDVDRKINALSSHLRKGERGEREREREKEGEESHKILAKYDQETIAEVTSHGTAIVSALRKTRGDERSKEKEIDYHLLSGTMAIYSGRKPYLVNPLTLVSFPASFYEDLFGCDVDPECLIPLLKIWRMEKWRPVEVTSQYWGQFHTRDAYIVLWVTDKDEKQVFSLCLSVCLSLSLSLSLCLSFSSYFSPSLSSLS
jgi:hypothetical protein